MKKILLLTSILFLTISTSLFAQQPTNLQSQNITYSSVDLSWDASNCGGNVNLKYREVGGAAWNPNINNVTSPYLLTGLLAETDYEWTVKCVGISGWQTPEIFTTPIIPPTIASAFISQPILCNGGSASDEMQIIINQTNPLTVYKCLVGYYAGAGSSFFLSYESALSTTATTLNISGFNPDIDYCVRIVDSIVYYTANGGSSGSSTVGVYDEFCAVNFTQPDSLAALTLNVSSNLCTGDCIAEEDLVISGGTMPYSFSVNLGATINLANGISNFSFVALCADNYDIIVTDANGCSTLPVSTNFIVAPILPIIPNGTMSIFNLNGYNVSCNGFSDGTITALASGGTENFTYSIDGSNFQSSTIFSGLSAGTYTITYRDSNGCDTIENFTLNEPPLLLGTANVSLAVDCYNAGTGKIIFQVDPANPGIPGYVYSIDNFITDQTDPTFIDLLGDSTYIVKIMDTNGCIDSSLVYLDEPAQIIYSTILSDYNGYEVSCNNFSDGSIEFTVLSGGFAPYTYSIDDGATFSLGNTFLSQNAGTYNIKVKDLDGCIEASIDTLNDPGKFSLPLVSNTIDCFGNCNGEIVITPSNGAGQILYDIDGGTQVTTASFSALCGNITNGSYTFNAVDANGCLADTTISIAEPTDFVYATASNLDYCDQSDGQASITVVSGGTGILSYIWNNNPLLNSSTINNLVSGIYVVEVNDSNDCSFSESVTVLADEALTVSLTSVSPCLGDSSGTATVIATGVSPYSYQWSNINGLIIGETSATIINMPIGTYSVLVIDDTSCARTGIIDIIDGDAIVIDSITLSNTSCFGINDAQIEIFASGGNPQYTFSNTNGQNFFPNPVFGPLAPGTYTLIAKDINNCFDDTIVTFDYTPLLEIDSTVFTHINCFGLDDGAVQNIQFSGGTGPFEFAIDGGVHQPWVGFSDLDPGQHTVEVFDVNNCASSDIIFINEPEELVIDSILVSNWNNYQIRCNSDSSGYIYLDFSGGTLPYLTDSTTFWDTITIDSIWAGYHTFIVEDANGCIFQDSILFEEPSPIEHNFIINHVSCVSWNNGSVTDSVSGGVGSATTYSYLWGLGETTYSLDNLSAATYDITVTDENGCDDTESVIISADNALNATPGTTINVTCNGGNDGELSVIASGGVPFSGPIPYTYLWNDDIAQNTPIALELSVDALPLASSVLYDCIVTDAVGCEFIISLELEQPEKLQVDVLITNPITCNGDSDGKLKAIVTGGEPTYTYTWSNGETNSIISDLPLGLYNLTVEDVNECRETFEIELEEPESLIISSIEEFDISCFGDATGDIQVFASGGSSFEFEYLYTLYLEEQFEDSVTHIAGSDILQQDTLVFNSLAPGNYYVIAEDRNGCTITSLSVEITEPFEPLTIIIDAIDETCSNDGIIRIFAEGGSQSFYYFINGGDTIINNIIEGNAPGWYNISVIDTRGCEINETTYIKAYNPIFLPDTLISIDTIICLGQSIDIDVEERPNLTYTWNDGVIGGDRVIKPEGILAYGTTEGYTTEYVLTVTDLEGCEIQNTVTVHFDAIDPMIDSDPGVLYGEYPVVLEGGDIDLFSNNTGDDIDYTWSWADNIIINTDDNSITISELSATDWYYLDVIDADGCLGYDSIYVVVGIKEFEESTVYEAITPNNDGFNDTWTPINIGSYQNALVQVFNRWGGLVFESNGGINYQAWDGTNKGEELAVGTYYYIIDLNTGDEPQTGPVTIIR